MQGWSSIIQTHYSVAKLFTDLSFQVRAEYRQIFLEMGFTEMPTNNYVESCFWNFDALFQPQAHPARDAQDTFFVSEPATATDFPKEYLEKVCLDHYCLHCEIHCVLFCKQA